jgi:hypothetical protein
MENSLQWLVGNMYKASTLKERLRDQFLPLTATRLRRAALVRLRMTGEAKDSFFQCNCGCLEFRIVTSDLFLCTQCEDTWASEPVGHEIYGTYE